MNHRSLPCGARARLLATVATVSIVVVIACSTTARAGFPAPARSDIAMVASAREEATEAGLEILRAGGNAVDAAIATTFAISVVEPFSAGIGGGGFAVVHMEPQGAAADASRATVEALDFRERAPAAATRGMFVDDKGAVKPGVSVDGYLSVAVPGTVPGLLELHRRHGALAWKRLLQPAIHLAQRGFVVGRRWEFDMQERRDVLSRYASTRAVFFRRTKDGEVPLRAGDVLKQPDLARTLQAIAADPTTMTTGRIARAIADDVQAHGGILGAADLAAYKPLWRDPICGDWQGMHLCTMPPPSSGGVHLLQILNLVGDAATTTTPWHDVDFTHRLIESMRIAYADRATWLGDPAFSTVPTRELASMSYADARRGEIDPLHARRSVDVKAGTQAQLAAARALLESKDTSHLTVVDKDRNAVSLTFTVNYGFGSGVIVPTTGILLNDEMDDFAAAPGVPNSYGLVGGDANSVQPGKTPLSSMTPLIATKDGHFFMTAGAPGGSTIITTTLQTLLHVALFGMDAQAAVSAPRLHQQWLPEETRVERFGLDDATKRALEARGHRFVVSGNGWGNAMCIVRRTVDGHDVLEGGADPRGEGVARGL